MGSLLCIIVLAGGYPRADMLIEAEELAKSPKDWVVIDVRGRNQFDAGHIAGSSWIDTKEWNKAFQKPETTEWSKRLAAVGIGPKSKVVVLGGDDVREAARAWFILNYWSLPAVRLLNGGWSAWQLEKGPITKDLSSVAATSNELLIPRSELLATKEQLLAELRAKPPQFVDGRSKDEHDGVADTAKRNGKIPEAIHLEWSECIDPSSKKFKTAAELERLITDRKIDRNAPIVCYCQSGGRAAVVTFALQLMGGKQVKNYYRSWSEWGNAEDTPIQKR